MIGKILNGKLLIFAAFMLAGIVFAGTAGAAVLTVDDSGGADYMRIQDAIDNASAGDTVLVYSGTYYENVNVNKQIVLRGVDSGAGMPVIDAGGSGNVVVLYADGVTLDNFVVMNGTVGINLISGNNIIRNSTIQNNGFDGIDLASSSNNILIGNTMNSNGFNGIQLTSSSNNTLIGNTVNSSGFNGVELTSSSNNTLIGNTANFNRRRGIALYRSDNNNLISNNANGSKDTDWRSAGIRIGYTSNNNSLINNTANSNNAVGILIDYYSEYNIVSGNIVGLNGLTGIRLGGDVVDSHSNIIYNNYFNNIDNVFVSTNSMNNSWNITRTTDKNIVGGPYLGGNFWAHPNGIGFSQICSDTDREGICDSPYTIDGSNTDYLPLSMNFTVTYNFLGILPPIRADGSSIFKLGSTVPVKFRITDANGNYVTTVTATLTYQLLTNEVLGTVEEPISSGAANEGNTFRYDSTDNLYIFNLGTDGMNAGTYQLNINLDDGTVHTVRISLR